MNTRTKDRISFCEWFDPNNIDHLHAYHILQKTGAWPVDFIPKNIWIENNWQAILAFKLADKWIDYKLSDNNKVSDEYHTLIKKGR